MRTFNDPLPNDTRADASSVESALTRGLGRRAVWALGLAVGLLATARPARAQNLTVDGYTKSNRYIGDMNSTSYDLWIQGGPPGSTGAARHIALLGDKNQKRLFLNFGNGYENGLYSHGSFEFAAGAKLGLGVRPANMGNRLLWVDDKGTGGCCFGRTLVRSLKGTAGLELHSAATGINNKWMLYANAQSESVHLLNLKENKNKLTLAKNGNLFITGTLTQYSDASLKTNIKNISGALDKVAALRGVTFSWKESTRDPDPQLGLIAQEVERVLPELVKTDASSGKKAVAYANLVSVLVEATKELKSKNAALRRRLERLERTIRARMSTSDKLR